MPEHPEIHWLWYYGIIFAVFLVLGFVGSAIAQWRRKSNDERRTHRRTWEKP